MWHSRLRTQVAAVTQINPWPRKFHMPRAQPHTLPKIGSVLFLCQRDIFWGDMLLPFTGQGDKILRVGAEELCHPIKSGPAGFCFGRNLC